MNFYHQHILSVDQFDTEGVERLFALARKMPRIWDKSKPILPLSRYILANLFFEASTRSRMSFASAFQKLGGSVNSTTGFTFSSISKGETLADTIQVMQLYCDVLVIRHPEIGAAAEAARYSQVPVINAGDGAGEHPTQALLDLFTIYQEKNRINGLTIGMVGDLRFGRTVHSLAKLLRLFKDITIIFTAPDVVQIPDSFADELRGHGITVIKTHDLADTLKQSDVVYTTRIQRERFTHPEEYQAIDGVYVLNREKIQTLCKPDVTIMHPLPRTNEIATDVDALPNAAYFREAENGVFVRMALFLLVLGQEAAYEHELPFSQRS